MAGPSIYVSVVLACEHASNASYHKRTADRATMSQESTDGAFCIILASHVREETKLWNFSLKELNHCAVSMLFFLNVFMQ